MMSKDEKLKFVDTYIENIRNQLVREIYSNKMPERWEGKELRRWIAEKFAVGVMPMTRKKVMEYNNDRKVLNI